MDETDGDRIAIPVAETEQTTKGEDEENRKEKN